MAATLDQIARFLEQKGLRFQREDARDMLVVPFPLEGSEPLLVAVTLEENGEFLKIFAPRLLTYKDGPNKLALLETLLLVSWETKMLQWEYDPSDGEVRAIVEFPIEDSVLTERQFFRAFNGLLQLLMRSHRRVKEVARSGRDPARDGPRDGDDPLADAFRRYLDGHDAGDKGTGGGPPDAL